MSELQRRAFLTLSGALLLSQAAAQDAPWPEKLVPPPPPKVLPKAWLDAPRIPLWPGDPPGIAGFVPQPLPADWSPAFLRNVSRPELRVFRPKRSNGVALLVIPGGSYSFVASTNEGVELAQRMTPSGTTVFVLMYRLPGEGWSKRSDVPLQDAQRAMRLVRANAARFEIHAEKIFSLGFSAGGHLAATLATQHAEHTYEPVDAADEASPRPFATGLIYPVITMDRTWTHAESRTLLLGESPSQAEVERRSAERHVDANTPSVFIVHAFDDDAVPVENSLRFMDAMRAARRPVEAHLLQEGGHAFGVGFPNTVSAHWVPLFSSWMQRVT